MKRTAKFLFLKISLLSPFLNIAIASSGYEDEISTLKIPMFSPVTLTESECRKTKPSLRFLNQLDSNSNPNLAFQLSKIHLEAVNVFDISINPLKSETKESYTQTDHILIQNDNNETYLSNLLSNKERILEQIGFIKNRSKNLLETIERRNKQYAYSPNELIEKIDSMEETTQEEITQKKAFIKQSIINTTNHFEKLKNDALEKLLKVEKSLDQKVIKTEKVALTDWFYAEALLFTNPGYNPILDEIARVRANLKHVVTNEYRFNDKKSNSKAWSQLPPPQMGIPNLQLPPAGLPLPPPPELSSNNLQQPLSCTNYKIRTKEQQSLNNELIERLKKRKMYNQNLDND